MAFKQWLNPVKVYFALVSQSGRGLYIGATAAPRLGWGPIGRSASGRQVREEGELGGLVWKGGTLWDKILPVPFLLLKDPAGFQALGNKEASPLSLGSSGLPPPPQNTPRLLTAAPSPWTLGLLELGQPQGPHGKCQCLSRSSGPLGSDPLLGVALGEPLALSDP